MNFKEIINQNKNNVKKIIKLITKDENEDIEQEVYIKVWKKSDSYEERGKITGWIGTIAKNFSKDYLKSSEKKLQDNLEEDENKMHSIWHNNLCFITFYIMNVFMKLTPSIKDSSNMLNS